MTENNQSQELFPENEAPVTETTGEAPGAESATLPEYTMADLPEPLRAGFNRLGWNALMQVQARAIPYIMAHRDVMIQSRTGSGKTGAYLVPIFQRINPEQNTTQALVLVPTRELATQVIHEAEELGRDMNVRTVAVYGGVGYGQQLDAFRKGAHLVVGTPGRILDHLLRRSLDLEKLKILVFDEADRMLSMGFYPDMKRVQRYLPRGPINSYMFSATFPPRVLALSKEFMRSPDFLNLSSDHVHVTEVQHTYYNVPAMDKERSLIRIIEVENPASAIVFCNRRERVHFVATILERYGYNAAEISSDLSQAAREQVMEQIREGRLRFLVATDVASRGIDIPELSHVILYEAPEDPESYIHRAGRTGRAGASGVAISLVNALEKAELMRISKRFQIDLQERQLPTEEEVQTIINQRTEALLEARLRERDRLQTERMQRFIPFLQNLQNDEAALSGVAMLLDDFYHENFHTIQNPQPDGTPMDPMRDTGYAPRKKRQDRKPGSRTGGSSSGGSFSRPAGRGPGGEPGEEAGSAGSGGGEAAGGGRTAGGGETTGGGPAASDARPSSGQRPSGRRRRRGGRGRGPNPGSESA